MLGAVLLMQTAINCVSWEKLALSTLTHWLQRRESNPLSRGYEPREMPFLYSAEFSPSPD